MASDRDRLSYDAKQQYRSVVAQQGRVMVPADFNEMQEIAAEELREEALDFVGPCGTPDNGYQITIPDSSTVPLDFLINPGTMYVGGIRAYLPPSKDLKEKRILYSKQPDRLNPTPQMPVGLGGSFLEFILLELWEQEISATEDPNLKDVALGGPDTTQRTRIIQAVTRYITTADTCDKALAAQADLWKAGGQDFDPTTMRLNSQASLKVGFENVVSDPNPCDPVAQGGYLGAENQLIRVRISELGEVKKSGKFVWGFDNSSFVYRVTLGSDGKTLKLDVPPIDAFHFPKKNQAVEVLGTQAVLSDGEFVATDTGTVFLLADDYNPDTLSVSLPSIYKPAPNTPQLFLRVWQEQIAFEAGKPKSLGQTGVQVTLRTNADTFHLSDYWAFAVRPNTPARVYPKRYVDDYQAPEGPRKWVCPLAVIKWTGNIQPKGEVLADCTNFFPALTALTSFFYLGGDGQEAHLDGTLPYPLEAGVANGKYPVKGARVRFSITKGGGKLAGGAGPVEVLTGADGMASSTWALGDPSQDQVVRAELLGPDGRRRHLPIDFSSSYMRARDVIYEPGECQKTQSAKNVQDAIDILSHLVSLYYLSGSCQQVIPGVALQPLRVLVANRCGLVIDGAVVVRFSVVRGSGTLNGVSNTVDVTADATGVATCNWTPDQQTSFQEVEANLIEDSKHPVAAPTTMRFCATIKPSGGCAVTVGKGGQFSLLADAVKTLMGQAESSQTVDLCICLLAGDHELKEGLTVQQDKKRQVHVKIEGCGRGSRILLREKGLVAMGLTSLVLRDLEISASGSQAVVGFSRCLDIRIQDCYLHQEDQDKNAFITIDHARRICFKDNVTSAFLSSASNPQSPVKLFETIDPALSKLYSVSDTAQFEQLATGVASTLAAQPQGSRAAINTKLESTLQSFASKITPNEFASYRDFGNTLQATSVNVTQLQANLAAIRIAALGGTILALMDAEAETRLEGNKIEGVVSLYGSPVHSVPLTPDELKLISSVLRATTFNSFSNLHVSNNEIFRLGVSETMIATLKSLSPSPTNTRVLDGLFRRCFINGNAFSGGNNEFVMEHLALNSNTFEGFGAGDAGVVMGKVGIYVGNYAPNDIRLFSIVTQNIVDQTITTAAPNSLERNLNPVLNVVTS